MRFDHVKRNGPEGVWPAAKEVGYEVPPAATSGKTRVAALSEGNTSHFIFPLLRAFIPKFPYPTATSMSFQNLVRS